MSLVQAGEYILEAKLGEGGMGAVFRGRHPKLPGKSFAVKVLGGNLSVVAAARFKREMEVLGSLPPNPYVVTIHGGDASAERPYYVMELVEGPSLGKLSKGGTLDPRRAAELVRDAARGIAHAHSHGVLHRDLKPENILVAADGTARVCDFGLARTVDSSRLTMSGAFVGTPHFASPEQLAGDGEEVDIPADIYGLGGILYFALVGHVPFEETAMERLIARLMSERPRPPSEERTAVPAALDAICLRALEKAPEDRYETADDLADDLDAFLDGRTAVAVIDSDARARRKWTIAIAGAVLLLAGSIGGLLVRSKLASARVLEAALATDDPAGVEAQLDELARSGAGEAALEPLRRRVLDLARGAVERPRATPAEIDDNLARIERHARDRAARDASLVALVASIVSAGPRAGEPSAVRRKVARIALACPEAMGLVGEEMGPIPGGLADFALAPRDAEVSERLTALAAARLRARPDDGTAHALRAYATLSRLGAPTRAFGPGTLGTPLPDLEAVLDDLAAATMLPGALGARASFLRVDLLVGAGSASVARAREALDATPVTPGTEVARADFEALLAAPPPLEERAAEHFARLVADSAAGDRRAAFVLSRLFALWDAPSAIEWPELAADPTEDAIARALALDDEARFALAQPPAERDDAEADDATPEERAKGLKKTQFRKKPRLAEIRAAIKGGLALMPRDTNLLYKAGSRIWDLLTRCIFLWLEAPAMLRTASLDQCFSRAARELTHVADSKSLGPKWDVSAREFDARLQEDVAEDELLQECIANGIPAAEVATIARGMGGMKRLEELEDKRSASPAERSRLAFVALQRLDQLARVPGPALLPFRARARAQALGAPLGDVLAALDLDRARRVASRVSSPVPDTAGYLFVAAAAAASSPGSTRARARWEPLYELAHRWHGEIELASKEVADPTQAVAVREDALKARHAAARDLIALQPGFTDLARLRGLDRVAKDFDVTPEERERLLRPRPFAPPR